MPCDAPVTTATFCSVLMIHSVQSKTSRFALFSAEVQASTSPLVNQRIVFGPFQDRMQLSTADADVASAEQRKRERILQQASQREA